MKLTATLFFVLAAASSSAALAQRPSRSSAVIPAQFHGRWAENRAACRTEHFTTVITINRTGWSSFEEGGRVVRAGQVRSGTHHFRVENFAGANETRGSLAMRREGARIVMTFQDDNERPVHYRMIRCR